MSDLKFDLETLYAIAGQFEIEGRPGNIYPFGSGHINDTFKVETPARQYLLQRVNHSVFKDVGGLTGNLIAVTAHLRKKMEGPGRTMQVLNSLPAREGGYFTIDARGNYWRVLDFLEGSHSYDKVPGETIAREGGRAYGWFVRMLDDFPAAGLVDTIPGFHNAASRIGQFRDAVDRDAAGRLGKVRDLVGKLLGRAPSMMLIHDLGKAGQIPVRVTHNDTKINNVLFNDRDECMCVIDLDTVMPGYVHFDFGDAIRTFANDSDEDETRSGRITFNMDHYRGFAEGFLSEVGPILNERELSTLSFAPRYITFEQTIRFLTDHLDGDTYYKIRYAGHNLVRAIAQFRLLEEMEKHAAEMEEVIRRT